MLKEPQDAQGKGPEADLRTVRQWMLSRLLTSLDAAEADALVRIFLSHISGYSWPRLLAEGFHFNSSQIVWISECVSRLTLHEPWQYIIGEVEFTGLKLIVSPAVLIPRPETEELAMMARDLVRQDYAAGPGLRILDLATGSGCLALSLKHGFPEARVDAVDISPAALEVAAENAERNALEINLITADLLSPTPKDLTPGYQLILSNPPYVRLSEKTNMASNVLAWEPHEALFVPDQDPLVFYRALAQWGRSLLAPSGKMIMEINEALSQETAQVFIESGFAEALLLNDFRGKSRFLKVS